MKQQYLLLCVFVTNIFAALPVRQTVPDENSDDQTRDGGNQTTLLLRSNKNINHSVTDVESADVNSIRGVSASSNQERTAILPEQQPSQPNEHVGSQQINAQIIKETLHMAPDNVETTTPSPLLSLDTVAAGKLNSTQPLISPKGVLEHVELPIPSTVITQSKTKIVQPNFRISAEAENNPPRPEKLPDVLPESSQPKPNDSAAGDDSEMEVLTPQLRIETVITKKEEISQAFTPHGRISAFIPALHRHGDRSPGQDDARKIPPPPLQSQEPTSDSLAGHERKLVPQSRLETIPLHANLGTSAFVPVPRPHTGPSFDVMSANIVPRRRKPPLLLHQKASTVSDDQKLKEESFTVPEPLRALPLPTDPDNELKPVLINKPSPKPHTFKDTRSFVELGTRKFITPSRRKSGSVPGNPGNTGMLLPFPADLQPTPVPWKGVPVKKAQLQQGGPLLIPIKKQLRQPSQLKTLPVLDQPGKTKKGSIVPVQPFQLKAVLSTTPFQAVQVTEERMATKRIKETRATPKRKISNPFDISFMAPRNKQPRQPTKKQQIRSRNKQPGRLGQGIEAKPTRSTRRSQEPHIARPMIPGFLVPRIRQRRPPPRRRTESAPGHPGHNGMLLPDPPKTASQLTPIPWKAVTVTKAQLQPREPLLVTRTKQLVQPPHRRTLPVQGQDKTEEGPIPSVQLKGVFPSIPVPLQASPVTEVRKELKPGMRTGQNPETKITEPMITSFLVPRTMHVKPTPPKLFPVPDHPRKSGPIAPTQLKAVPRPTEESSELKPVPGIGNSNSLLHNSATSTGNTVHIGETVPAFLVPTPKQPKLSPPPRPKAVKMLNPRGNTGSEIGTQIPFGAITATEGPVELKPGMIIRPSPPLIHLPSLQKPKGEAGLITPFLPARPLQGMPHSEDTVPAVIPKISPPNNDSGKSLPMPPFDFHMKPSLNSPFIPPGPATTSSLGETTRIETTEGHSTNDEVNVTVPTRTLISRKTSKPEHIDVSETVRQLNSSADGEITEQTEPPERDVIRPSTIATNVLLNSNVLIQNSSNEPTVNSSLTQPMWRNGSAIRNLNRLFTPNLQPIITQQANNREEYGNADFALSAYKFAAPIILVILILFTVVLVLVLTHQMRSGSEMNKASHCLLISIAVLDLLTVMAAVPEITYVYSQKTEDGVLPFDSCFTLKILERISPISNTASVWITVFLSVQRFICVSRPFKAKSLMKVKTAVIVICTAVLSSFGFYFVRFVDTTFVPVNVTSSIDPNKTVETCRMVYTSIINNPYVYETVFIWCHVFGAKFIPCGLLLTFGILLCVQLKRTESELKKMKVENLKSYKERRMLSWYVMIITAIVCLAELPVGIVLCLYSIQLSTSFVIWDYTTIKSAAYALDILLYVSYFAIFFIYCIMSRKFRSLMRRLCHHISWSHVALSIANRKKNSLATESTTVSVKSSPESRPDSSTAETRPE